MDESSDVDVDAVRQEAGLSMNVSIQPFITEVKDENPQEPERDYGSPGSHYVNTSTDYLSSDSKHYVKKRSGW
jgi:hypothetical protein